jgi:fructose-bisphosphate aldolase class II
MALTLKQIRENTTAARKLMAKARKEKFAVGAFNLDNQDILKSVVNAAVKLKAPVLVEVSKGEVDAIGIDNVRDMVDNYKEEFGVEMYINLDHSPSVMDCIEAIEAGYEFIHIDISQANHEAAAAQIIEETKRVVACAKLTGALVESEPHYFGGGSNLFKEAFDYNEIKKTFSSPEDAKAFVEATGIDTYAAAVGNLHGKYPVPKKLDIDLLKEVRKAIDCNISLHGGSGTPGHYYKEAVLAGVTKININSDMRVAYRQTLERVLDENPDEFAVVKLMDEVVGAVQRVVEDKIKLFNAEGKARSDR